MGLSAITTSGEGDLADLADLQSNVSQEKRRNMQRYKEKKMVRKIMVFDTTLRDGEQVPGAKLGIDEKVEIAHQLVRLNVDAIEAGFPTSSPGDFEAVSRIAREVKGPVIVGLARAVKRDIEAVSESVKWAERPRIHVFLGSSDIHIEKQLRIDRKKAFEWAVESIKYAKKFCEDVEYSPMDATRSDLDYICSMIEETIKAGATVINIPDTVGYAVPEEFGVRIAQIRERVPNIHKVILSVHCHNDLGMATGNTLAGVRNGADQVECTINGIGERAGNASLEEVVIAIKTRCDIYQAEVSINTREIMTTSRLVSRLMGIPVQPNKAIVGSNAFAHSSGIHQDGILKDRRTFEIISPEEVGIVGHQLVLTARSGRHALRHKLEELGYSINGGDFDGVYRKFLEVADRKKKVEDEDLRAIMA